MHDIVDCQNAVYMVLEMMRGGDLISRIEAKTRLSEPSSKLLFLQICHAVKYLHDKGITHRDIKPDNILLATNDDETLVKVSDFGLSKFVAKGSIMKTLCGTPYYLAPEVLSTKGEGTYNKKVDIWSLGVVLYAWYKLSFYSFVNYLLTICNFQPERTTSIHERAKRFFQEPHDARRFLIQHANLERNLTAS